MKINVKMLDECGIKYDCITLYIGISVNLVECKELSIYALKELENNEDLDNEFIIEVAWGNEDYLKEELLSKMILHLNLEIPVPNSDIWNFEIRKLRYSKLNYLNSTIDDASELLKNVEEVYADFCYPQEMKEFILYMPVEDNVVASSIEDNIKRMVNSFESFLIDEKKALEA